MIRKLKLFVGRLRFWNKKRKMALIDIELYGRAKARGDSETLSKWAVFARHDVQEMIDEGFPFLTKLFLDANEDALMDICRTYRLDCLKGKG